jgi:hypothetical protein
MKKIRQRKKSTRGGPHDTNIAKVVNFEPEEWARIASTSSLPKNARLRIGIAIAWYRSEKAAQKTSLNTKRSVKKVRDYATKLDQQLKDLLKDPIFFSAGLPYWSPTPKPQSSDFAQLFDSLEQLQSLMEETQSRMRMAASAQP